MFLCWKDSSQDSPLPRSMNKTNVSFWISLVQRGDRCDSCEVFWAELFNLQEKNWPLDYWLINTANKLLQYVWFHKAPCFLCTKYRHDALPREIQIRFMWTDQVDSCTWIKPAQLYTTNSLSCHSVCSFVSLDMWLLMFLTSVLNFNSHMTLTHDKQMIHFFCTTLSCVDRFQWYLAMTINE